MLFNRFNSKNNGFTLAEVLITLGIIGVVAAMTLPTLIQNQQKRSLEVATQKFYSTMSQAVKKYMADEGVDDLRNTPLTDMSSGNSGWEDADKACEDFVQKYLKVAKVCEDGCFADNYKMLNGEISAYIGLKSGSYTGTFMLADGAVFDINAGSSWFPIDLYVDVNGRKGPNKIGYDLWSMDIFYDGSIDEGMVTPECKKYGGEKCVYGNSPSDAREHRFESCKENPYGGCFGHFLENNFKFDY